MKGLKKPPSQTRSKVTELDSLERCGKLTTVIQLFRVETLDDDQIEIYLVFRDRHGLYCDHGRDCVAVKYVMDSGKLIPTSLLEFAM